MRPVTLVTNLLAAVLTLHVAACETTNGPSVSESDRTIMGVRDIPFSELSMASLERVPLTIVGTVDATVYRTPAYFPGGMVEGETTAGRCVDLVADRATSRRMVRGAPIELRVDGYFVMPHRLPAYAFTLDIDGRRHTPTCQIFSNAESYPYFVVTHVHGW